MSLSLTEYQARKYAALLAFESSLQKDALRCLLKSRACGKRARRHPQGRRFKAHFADHLHWLGKFHTAMGRLHAQKAVVPGGYKPPTDN